MRSTHTTYPEIPTASPDGDRDMFEPLRLNPVDYLVNDRIEDLRRTARQVKTAARPTDERSGVLGHARWSLGRFLITLGASVAGQRA